MKFPECSEHRGIQTGFLQNAAWMSKEYCTLHNSLCLRCIEGCAGVIMYAVYGMPSLTGGMIQGFMQDQIIASHTCFDGHMDVNC